MAVKATAVQVAIRSKADMTRTSSIGRKWPETEVPRCPRFVRDRMESGHSADALNLSKLTQRRHCALGPVCTARPDVIAAKEGIALLGVKSVR